MEQLSQIERTIKSKICLHSINFTCDHQFVQQHLCRGFGFTDIDSFTAQQLKCATFAKEIRSSKSFPLFNAFFKDLHNYFLSLFFTHLLSFSLFPSLTFFLSISHFLSHPSIYLSLFLSFSLLLFLSLYLSLPLPLSLSVRLSDSFYSFLLISFTLTYSFFLHLPPQLSLSLFVSVFLSLSLPLMHSFLLSSMNLINERLFRLHRRFAFQTSVWLIK